MSNTDIIPQTVMVQHYKSLDAGSHVGGKALTFLELVDYLSKYYIDARNKCAGGLFVTSDMSDPYRVDKNILNKTAITMDFDDIPTGFNLVQFFKDNFKNSFIIYSTWRHTEELQRLRVVIPLTKPLPTQYYSAAVTLYEKAVGFQCDQHSKVLSQAMAIQTVKHEDAHRIFEVKDTSFTDTDKLIELIKRQQPDRTIKNSQLIKRDDNHWDIAYAGMSAGDGRNSAATSLLGLLLRRYVPLKVAIALLQHWNNGNNEPLSEKELSNIIRSVVKIETNRRGGEVT